MTISGVTCVYPSTFNSNPTTGNQKLNLTDALGGATMTVSQEGKSGAPSDLMRDYARQTGGDDVDDTLFAVSVGVFVALAGEFVEVGAVPNPLSFGAIIL